MKDAQWRLASIKRDKKGLDHKKQNIEEKISTLLFHSASVLCRSFCHAFQQTLPRELRDVVYEHLMDYYRMYDPHQVMLVDDASLSLYPCFFRPLSTEGSGWSNAPHIWDENYVGYEFVRELAERWHKSTTFDFASDFHLIPKLIASKNWSEVHPADLVRSVRFMIAVLQIEDDQEIKYADAPNVTALLEQLQPLTCFKSRVHIQFDISLPFFLKNETIQSGNATPDDKVMQRENAFRHLLKDLWPLISQFNSRGDVITIVLNLVEIGTADNVQFSHRKLDGKAPSSP